MTIFKSYKSDVMPLSSELDMEMRRWLRAYQDECGPLDKNWFLVPAVKNAGQFGNFALAPDRRTGLPTPARARLTGVRLRRPRARIRTGRG